MKVSPIVIKTYVAKEKIIPIKNSMTNANYPQTLMISKIKMIQTTNQAIRYLT